MQSLCAGLDGLLCCTSTCATLVTKLPGTAYTLKALVLQYTCKARCVPLAGVVRRQRWDSNTGLADHASSSAWYS